MRVLFLSDNLNASDPRGDFSGGYNNLCRVLFESGAIQVPEHIKFSYDYLNRSGEKLTDATLRKSINISNYADFDIIFLLGARVSKVFGLNGKMSDIVGTRTQLENGTTLIPCYAPAAIEQNASYQTKIATLIYDQLYFAVTGEEQIRDKPSLTGHNVITTKAEFDALILQALEDDTWAFDFETTSLKHWLGYVTIMSVATRPGAATIIPYMHYETVEWEGFSMFDRIDYINSEIENKIFANKKIRKYVHNLMMEGIWCMGMGMTQFKGEWFDVMLMSHVLDENTLNGLKYITEVYFPEFAGYQRELPPDTDWGAIPMKELAAYGATDADMTLRAGIQFEIMLLADDDDGTLYRLFRSHVMPSAWALAWTSFRGSLIDKRQVAEAIDKCTEIIERRTKEFYAHPKVASYLLYLEDNAREIVVSGIREKLEKERLKEKPRQRFLTKWAQDLIDAQMGKIETKFSLGSSAKVARWLYGEEFMNMPLKVTFKGEKEAKTDKGYILELAQRYNSDILLTFSTIKMVTKLRNTYYKAFATLPDPQGLLHTEYKCHGTRTGRISATNPNLQNISNHVYIRDDADLVWAVNTVRRCFICPPPGMHGPQLFVQLDYSQAELRLVANFSGDPIMQQAYLDKQDLHSVLGASILEMSLEEFKKLADTDPVAYKQGRTWGKMGNFSGVYGISVHGYRDYVRRATNGKIIDDEEAQHQLDGIRKIYRKLPEWWEIYKTKAVKYGYVRTLFGRKRRLPDVYSLDRKLVAKAKRQAINSPIQGSSGEWTIFAMGVLSKLIPHDMSRFSNTIHDSVHLYMADEFIEVLAPIYEEIMVDPRAYDYLNIDISRLVVPMNIDWSITKKNWHEFKDIKYNSTSEIAPAIRKYIAEFNKS